LLALPPRLGVVVAGVRAGGRCYDQNFGPFF
jgi:hypothetical protein